LATPLNIEMPKPRRPQSVTIIVDAAQRVSGLLQVPHGVRACYVLAHGAGAGMSHPFMAAVANGLAAAFAF
jgi:predicted alpha/beta-hydrolase family hydrolase